MKTKTKSLIRLFLFILLSNSCLSQTIYIDIFDFKVFDNSNYILCYDVIMTSDSLNPSEKEYDKLILEIGKNGSKSYSYNLYKHDSVGSEYVKRGAEGIPSLRADYFPEDVYKTYSENKMTVFYRTPSSGPVLKYTEDLKLMNWSIKNETKTINGYLCQRATSTYRGRNWNVWFTMQIPVSDGPWKFFGLPGLILQAEDEKGYYSFVCSGIKNAEKQIIMPHYEAENLTFEEVWDFMKECKDDYNAYRRKIFPQATFVKAVKDASGKTTFVDMDMNEKRVLPYNPIEFK